MLIESSMLAADKPPDPELSQRNARRLIAMSRGLQVLISGVMLAILGLLLATKSDIHISLCVLILAVQSIAVPLLIKRSRERRGLGFMPRGEDYHAHLPWKVSVWTIAGMLGSGFLCIFTVWYSPLVMLAFPAAMAAFFVLGYRRTHLWECLWEAIISVVLTVPVLLMMVGSDKHAFPMLFLIVGMGSIVGGASLQVRWVHWARQHALQLAQETIQ